MPTSPEKFFLWCREGRAGLVKAELERGGDVDRLLHKANGWFRYMPLHAAAAKNQHEVVEVSSSYILRLNWNGGILYAIRASTGLLGQGLNILICPSTLTTTHSTCHSVCVRTTTNRAYDMICGIQVNRFRTLCRVNTVHAVVHITL